MAERPGGDNRTLAKPASLNGATAHSISLAVGTTRDTGMVGLSSPDAVASSPVTSFNKGGRRGVRSEEGGVRSEE